jgi:undecaprenyl-diphosphatase
MQTLLAWDKALFGFLNSGFHNSFLDWLMPVITNFSYFRIPFFLALVALFIWGGKKGRWLVILGVIGVGLADFTAHQFLKPLFTRPRPCHELENVRLLIGCGGFYGFPSNHACNFFGTATVFTYFYRKVGIVLFGLAFLVGWSRIYVGVHYPLDVIGGAIWGMLLAILVILLAKLWFKEKLNQVLGRIPKFSPPS